VLSDGGIVASAADLPTLEQALSEKGVDLNSLVLGYIPEEDILFGGAELRR
jgi:hypothetical protein